MKRLAPTTECTWLAIYAQRGLAINGTAGKEAVFTEFGKMIGSRRVVTIGLEPPKIQYSALATATTAASERSLEKVLKAMSD